MRFCVAVTVAATIAIAPAARAAGDPQALPGWSIYLTRCAACHGEAGDGRGPGAAFTQRPPRAFTDGQFKWRSTPVGQDPLEDDLRATVRWGADGTSMPAFGDILTAWQIDRAIDVVRAFAPKPFAASAAIALGPSRPGDPGRGAQLWTQLCEACHGEHGRGDGPSAKAYAIPPYDLAVEPIHRPHAPGAERAAVAMSILTGLSGTQMPAFDGVVKPDDVWSLADHVLALGAGATADHRALPSRAIASDTSIVGVYPAAGDGAQLFPAAIPAQGPPLAQLAPAEASLSARQCGRCHAKQVREWQPSLHAAAASPGFSAQVAHGLRDEPETCPRCHTPLAEQRADLELATEGATCAACHVRGWVRHGPPNLSPTLLAAPGYPRVEQTIYERADFCMPCHQLPARTAVAGRPLLDTYREWLEGPYMPRGIECQSCHMPNREHTWLGIHDPTTFRQGAKLTASAHRSDLTAPPFGGAAGRARVPASDRVTVLAELENIGAGHDLPTTPTPAVWLRIALVDCTGAAIAGAADSLRIGRDVYFDGRWHERADTRIPPGEHVAMARAWSGGRTAEATAARITVEVHPDDYYEHLYEARLAGELPGAQRTLYEQALARARSSRYVAFERVVPIALSSPR